MSKAMFPTAYSTEFEEARKAYRPPANDSKMDAYKAWGQTKLHRPERPLLIASIKAYDEFIATSTTERARFKQSPYPRQHMSSWLRGRGWENETIAQRAIELMQANEAMKELSQGISESDKSKIEGWSKLRAEIGDPAFGAYFVHAIYDETKNAIVLPKLFLVSLVNERHLNAIHRSFNPDTLVTCEG